MMPRIELSNASTGAEIKRKTNSAVLRIIFFIVMSLFVVGVVGFAEITCVLITCLLLGQFALVFLHVDRRI